mmetsp:Transcript_28381/g.62383  ORF Transcript_28381/g.62383 Transcript_28381/m.62383 type:complete len:255 (+) Transcript_28381:210-974(+)
MQPSWVGVGAGAGAGPSRLRQRQRQRRPSSRTRRPKIANPLWIRELPTSLKMIRGRTRAMTTVTETTRPQTTGHPTMTRRREPTTLPTGAPTPKCPTTPRPGRRRPCPSRPWVPRPRPSRRGRSFPRRRELRHPFRKRGGIPSTRIPRALRITNFCRGRRRLRWDGRSSCWFGGRWRGRSLRLGFLGRPLLENGPRPLMFLSQILRNRSESLNEPRLRSLRQIFASSLHRQGRSLRRADPRSTSTTPVRTALSA